jgi:hypothetical protein
MTPIGIPAPTAAELVQYPNKCKLHIEKETGTIVRLVPDLL